MRDGDGRGRRPPPRHRPGRAHLARTRAASRRTASSTSPTTSGPTGASAASPPRGGWRAPARRRCGRARDRSCSSCRPSAWPAPPSSRCWPRSPKACACWPRACGRQWGVDGATVNTVAAAPHHWLDADTADALTRGISLSTPAFGGHGERGRRPRAADRAARRPRRALPHRGDAGRRRRHLGGPVTALEPDAARGQDGRGHRRRRWRRPRHRPRVRDPRRQRRDRGAAHRDRRRRRRRDRGARRRGALDPLRRHRSAPTSRPRSRAPSTSSARST